MEEKDTPVQGILSLEKAPVKATETKMWQGCVFWSLLGPSRFLGNCTEEGKGKEKSGNKDRGEQREIPMFRKEVDDGSIEDQT